ncbi:MAG: hypothetical protein FJ104_00645 [Deltaproteobacteria bacterium]|nr:hypothetical protein [Deltaproteobacteria bacterium]
MTRSLVFGLALALALGCSSESKAPQDSDAAAPLFAPEDVASLPLVRACRAPGEHSGLDGFTVRISQGAEAPLAELFEDPPGVAALPAGALVVKELFASPDCAPGTLTRYTAMRKEPGFAPESGDWHWQELSPEGRVLIDGAVAACIDCHRGGASGSCAGFGEAAGRDWFCTAP